MAASPSAAKIARANRESLYTLRRRLLKLGIESRYEKKTAALEIVGANVEWAGYRLLRASNGECALFPRVKLREAVRDLCDPAYTPRPIYEGWDAFDKIARL